MRTGFILGLLLGFFGSLLIWTAGEQVTITSKLPLRFLGISQAAAKENCGGQMLSGVSPAPLPAAEPRTNTVNTSDDPRVLQVDQAAERDAKDELARVESFIKLSPEQRDRLYKLYVQRQKMAQLNLTQEEYEAFDAQSEKDEDILGPKLSEELRKKEEIEAQLNSDYQNDRQLALLRKVLNLNDAQVEKARATLGRDDVSSLEEVSYVSQLLSMTPEQEEKYKQVFDETSPLEFPELEARLAEYGGIESLDREYYFHNTGNVDDLNPEKVRSFLIRQKMKQYLSPDQIKSLEYYHLHSPF